MMIMAESKQHKVLVVAEGYYPTAGGFIFNLKIHVHFKTLINTQSEYYHTHWSFLETRLANLLARILGHIYVGVKNFCFLTLVSFSITRKCYFTRVSTYTDSTRSINPSQVSQNI